MVLKCPPDTKNSLFTLWLLVSSADNLCKQFNPDQTLLRSKLFETDVIPDFFSEKKNQQMTIKACTFTQLAKS